MPRLKEIPFHVPWITREDRKAVYESLRSRWLTGGAKTKTFEDLFANYVGAKYAVSLNSCTSALHLAMRIIKIKPGDEVIVPDLTFAATANAALFCGAKPIFADIDEKTFNISPNDIKERITDKTRAIIPVHYGGQPCDMKEILEIAEDYKLDVVEDCAHSLGATYCGKQTGNFGTIGCFSFYPTKTITTLEGGMIVTDDPEVDRKARLFREHGMNRTAIQRESSGSWFYDVVDLGYNYRLTEPQAALGISQLKRVDEGTQQRINLAQYYSNLLKGIPGLIVPYVSANRLHIFHLYVIKIQKHITGISRNRMFELLSNSGIQCSVHYTPLHLLSFYKQFQINNTRPFPIAERIYDEILSLPIYPKLKKTNTKYVGSEIKSIIRLKSKI